MKCTIVSFFPKDIYDVRPSQIPFEYTMPGCTDGKTPGICIIDNSKSILYQPGMSQNFVLTINAEDLADDLVKGFLTAQPEAKLGCHPAVFWVPGEFTAAEVLIRFKKECEAANAAQNLWFLEQIKVADKQWSKHHSHHLITDIQRLAAMKFGLKKEWTEIRESIAEVFDCPACGQVISKSVALCPNCKVIIDAEKAKALKFAS